MFLRKIFVRTQLFLCVKDNFGDEFLGVFQFYDSTMVLIEVYSADEDYKISEKTKTYNGIKDLVQRRKDDKISTESPFMLAVALKDTKEMIGEIVVMPNENTFSLGYTFSYKHHRQGYAFESLSVLIDFLHKKFGDWEFISFTDPKNEASIGLLIKLGYKDLGYLPSKESQVFGKWITKATETEIKQVCR